MFYSLSYFILFNKHCRLIEADHLLHAIKIVEQNTVDNNQCCAYNRGKVRATPLQTVYCLHYLENSHRFFLLNLRGENVTEKATTNFFIQLFFYRLHFLSVIVSIRIWRHSPRVHIYSVPSRNTNA